MGPRLLLLLFIAGPGMLQLGSAQDISASENLTEPGSAETLPDTQEPEPSTPQSSPPAQVTRPKGFDGKGWKQLTPNLLSDQKAVWLFPSSVARGHHVKPTLVVTGTTAGLVGLDPYTAKYFQENRNTTYRQFNKIFSSKNTAIGTIAVPLALYGVGLVRRDVYAQRTFLLAGEAVLTSEILTTVMKDVTRRNNPALVPPGGNFSDTWFKKTEGNWIRGIGSFPSGHTIAAYSVAAVYAQRYPKPRWKGIVAYSLAGVVGFSRSSLEAHFVSDVVLGAALGYFISRHVVRADEP